MKGKRDYFLPYRPAVFSLLYSIYLFIISWKTAKHKTSLTKLLDFFKSEKPFTIPLCYWTSEKSFLFHLHYSYNRLVEECPENMLFTWSTKQARVCVSLSLSEFQIDWMLLPFEWLRPMHTHLNRNCDGKSIRWVQANQCYHDERCAWDTGRLWFG